MAYNVTISETVNDVVVDSPGYPITINYNATVIESTGNVANLQAEIDAVEANVVILQGNVTTLTADVANNTANIATVQGNITTLTADVANNTANITTLQGNVATIESDVANNAANITTNTSRIANIEANVTQATGVITTGNLSAGNIVTTGSATIGGNLAVQGNITYISSNTVTIGDKFINLANAAANSTQANGGGIGIGPVGSEYATLEYVAADNVWTTGLGFVATGNVTAGNITTAGTGNIDNIATDAVQFDLTAAETTAAGKLYWNADDETLDLGLDGTVTVSVGQDNYYRVQANTAITKGQVVQFSGVQGDKILADVANAAAPGFDALYVIGLAAENIGAGSTGFVISEGKLRDINTGSFSVGNILWFDPATPGGVTVTEPTAPNPKIVVAAVLKTSPGNGGIYQVRVTSYPRLGDLQDVETAAATMNDFLRWDGSKWSTGALEIEYDTTPTLGGNLSGAGYTISNVAAVTATGNVTANNVSATRFVNVGTASDPGIVNVYDVGSVRLWDNNNTNYVGISAPGDVSTNYTVSLPAAQGAANTVLVNDGSGGLSWQATYGDSDVATLLAAFGSNSISTTGNITATSFIGDGSQLTGLPAGYTDSDVANLLAAFGSNTISTTGNVDMGNSAVTGTVSANVFLGTSGNVRFDPMQALQGLAEYGACTAPTTTATRDPGVIMVGNTAQLPTTGALPSDYNNQFNIYVSVNKQATPNVRQGGFNVQSTIDYGNGALTLGNDTFRSIQMQNFVTGNGAVVSSTSGLPWPIAFNGFTTVGQKSNGFTNVSAGNITVPGLFGMTSGLAVQQSTPGVLSQANSLINMTSTVAAGSGGGPTNPRGDVVIGNSVSYLASFAPRKTANATGTTTCGDYYGYAMFRSGSTVFPGGGASALDISGSPTYGNLWFVYNNDERFASYMAGNVTMGNSIANTQVTINQGDIAMTGNLEIGNAIAFSGNVAVTATDTTISHKIPVVINGVTYYIALTAAQ